MIKMYADLPGSRRYQLLGDLLFVAFLALCIFGAFQVHGKVLALKAPTTEISGSASDLGTSMSGAGDSVKTIIDHIPFTGGLDDTLADPFYDGADAANTIATTSGESVDEIDSLALWLSLFVGGLPMVLCCGYYLPGRVRWVQNATSGRKYIATHDDIDLFALRAMARQPLHVLAEISDDPAAAWRQGDPHVIRAMAVLEMQDCGMDPGRLGVTQP